jgi:hypothetical protein
MLSHKIDIATNTSSCAIAAVKSTTRTNPGVLFGTTLGAPNVPKGDYCTSSSWLESHGIPAKEWLAATAQATQRTADRPDQAVKGFESAYPNNSKTHAYNEIGWKASLSFLKNVQGQLMTQSASQRQPITTALKSNNLISKTYPAATYFTNAYLPK